MGRSARDNGVLEMVRALQHLDASISLRLFGKAAPDFLRQAGGGGRGARRNRSGAVRRLRRLLRPAEPGDAPRLGRGRAPQGGQHQLAEPGERHQQAVRVRGLRGSPWWCRIGRASASSSRSEPWVAYARRGGSGERGARDRRAARARGLRGEVPLRAASVRGAVQLRGGLPASALDDARAHGGSGSRRGRSRCVTKTSYRPDAPPCPCGFATNVEDRGRAHSPATTGADHGTQGPRPSLLRRQDAGRSTAPWSSRPIA